MTSGCGWCCRRWCCPPNGSAYGPVAAAAPPCCNGSTRYATPLFGNGPSYYPPPAANGPAFYPPPETAPLPRPEAGVWQPSDRGPVVTEIPSKPESGKGDQRGGAKLMPPAEEDRPAAPPKDLPPPEEPKFSAEIPQYNLVSDNVSAGIQPFPEGFTWLKNNGYRTVVFLRTPGEDDSALRAEIEAKGLRYVTLEVGPKTLNRELVQEFGRVIRDTKGHPLFAFDKKGMPAGAMWYLHFRLNEQATDADARGRATRLGLKDDQTGEYAELWLAINKALAGN
jgi:protein tyrosine phosphatase (PTP) superfamily phosphohydrolase (DUF442 family)